MSGTDLLLLAPGSVGEAVQVLIDAEEQVRVIAGGTCLMPQISAGEVRPEGVVLDIWQLEQLRGIRMEEGWLRIGALSTFTEVHESSIVRGRFPILAAAAGSLASLQVRNRATVGGNIMHASPGADLLPPLLVLDASVTLLSNEGPRRVPVYSFYAGHRRPIARPSELLTEVLIPPPSREDCHDYLRKSGSRGSLAVPKVSLAGHAEGVEKKGDEVSLARIRIGIGALSEFPTRLFETERFLENNVLDPVSVEKAVQILSSEITPSDDERSTPEYRRLVAGNMLREFLQSLSSS